MHLEIKSQGDENCSPHARSIVSAMTLALSDTSKANADLLSMRGMSGKRYRHFINNLVELTPNASYLEIGSWAGSTLCSAIYGNTVRATAIDNWSEFEGPQDKFFQNLSRFVSRDTRVSFLNEDFRKVTYELIGMHNIYLFDGPHAYQDQYDGLVKVATALEDEVVFIVDDWNWRDVREGTLAAIEAGGWSAPFSVQIRTSDNDRHPGEFGIPTEELSDWHNGYFVGVLKRRSRAQA